MATWEDGPEYAPRERPEGFADPVDATPLSTAERTPDRSAGLPAEQPRFDGPPVAVALRSLVPATSEPRRDPQEPYEVASATMTPDVVSPPTPERPASEPFAAGGTRPPAGAWGAAHWSGTSRPSPPFGPPGPTGPSPFPAPGTQQWFGPGPGDRSAVSGAPTVKAVWTAATPAVMIMLSIGLIFILAPLTLVIAFVLTSRMTVAKTVVRRVFGVALGVLGLVAVAGLGTNLAYGSGSLWWRGVSVWALVLTVALLVTVPLLVRHELTRRPPVYAPPAYGQPPYDRPPATSHPPQPPQPPQPPWS